MNELVSVIMPTYNCEEHIGASIESVIAQTYKEWELIIIDDCSEDNTNQIVKKYMQIDSRIQYIRNEKNVKAAVSRNIGIEKAKGKYIAFLDSDDLWEREKLKLQLRFMKQMGSNFSCTAYEKINENSEKLNRIIVPFEKADYSKVLLTNPIGNSTVIYNASKLGKVYLPESDKREDFALWLKILKSEKYVYGMKDILMQYRVRKNSVSRNKVALIFSQWKLYRETEKLSVRYSLYCISYFTIVKMLNLKEKRLDK